jgi:type IX secretion system substrate protein
MIMTRFMHILFFTFITITFSTIATAQCVIDEVEATAGVCENGQFFVTIGFNYEGVGNEGFSVHGNGVNYGSFGYADVPISIGPLDGDGSTPYEFVVTDNQYSDCTDFDEPGIVDCPGGDCAINDLVAEPGDCNADSTYQLWIDFNYQNATSSHFDVFYQGENTGFFNVADLPVVIENFEDNGEAFPAISVCFNDTPDCCAETEFEAPDCSGGDCAITDFVAEAGDCNSDGTYQLWLNFNYTNAPNDFFDVFYQGQNIGFFHLSDLPIVIEHFEDNGEPFPALGVCINDTPDCCAETEFEAPDCGGGDCNITEFVAEAGDCNAGGTYPLWLNFNYDNAPNNHFDVFYQGENIGFFNVADLPVVIEHFADNGEAFPVISVCINDAPDCCAETEFEAPGCEPCNILDLNVVAGDCENGMFYVTLDFEYQNVGSEGFSVHGNGISYGVFEYGELPLTLGPLAGNGTTAYEFVVKDVSHPGCSADTGLGIVECGQSGDCGIFDAVAGPLECNTDGTYGVAVNFGVAYAGNNFFNVKYQGETIVHHAPIAGLPYIIEHFEDNGNPNPVLVLCINDMPDCCVEVPFEAPDCPASDCHIYDVIAEAYDCDSTGHFLVDIAFEHQNTGSEGFTIVGNGNNYGTFDYGEPFYTIGPLAGNGTIYEFAVKDLEFEDCHGFTTLGPIYCGTNCHIYDLVASLSDCDSDGQFYITLDFEYENVGGEGFKVHGNGNVYGFFSYDELPVTAGPFSGNSEELEFAVSDIINPDCHDYIEIDAPDCGGGDCHIYDLTAEVHPCLPNGTFFVSLNFIHDNTSGYFTVKGNGINYGVFSYGDLPVSVGPLVGNGATPFEFLVQDIHLHDCAADVYVGPVDCGLAGDCHVFNVVADPGACDDNGSYNLWVNFEFENASNNYFDLFHNGDLVDYFPLSNIPVVVPHIYENGDSIQTVTICINDNPGCCDSTTYATPDCNIGNLVWPGDANADNVVSNFDLLQIGVGYGAEGLTRTVQGIEWAGLESLDWEKVFLSNLNYKHADCNGDGVINAGDMGAIFLNYGQSHDSVSPSILIGGIETDPPFYVDLPEADVLLNGSPFAAPIILGTEPLPVQNAYGIAFTLHFDPMVIDPSSAGIQYNPSWLGVQNVNLLTLDHSQATEGIIEVALVRTDGNNVSGFGQVAGFIGIIDNIAGKEQVTIEITGVKAISENEKLIPLYRPAEVVELVTATSELQQGVISVYPNPAGQYVVISHPDGLQIESVQLRDLNGKALITKNLVNNQLDISSLPAGVYTLHIRAGETNFVNRIVKL